MPRRSIRAEVLALLLVIALPVVALHTYWIHQRYQETRRLAEEEVLRTAEAVAASISQFLSLGHDVVGNLAASFAGEDLTEAACAARLRGLPDLLFFSNIAVWSPEGQLVCSANPTTSGPASQVADRAWFQQVVRDRAPAIGEPLVGRITGRWVTTIGWPVARLGEPLQGVVGAGFDLVTLGSYLNEAGRPTGALVTVVAGGRRVVYRSEDPESWVGRDLGGEAVPEREVAGRGAITHATDMAGVPRTFAKVPIPGTDWHAFVGKPDAVIVPPARRRAILDGVLGLSLLAVVAGGALAYYRRIGAALGQLEGGIEAAARGQPVPLPDESPAEVHAVGHQINRAMAARKEAESAERQAKERYQAILNNAVFGIFVSTLDGRFLEVNQALVDLLGYESRAALVAAGPAALYRDPARREAILTELGTSSRLENLELEWVRRDGRPIIVRVNGRVVHDPREGTCFEMVVEDITEQRALERQYRQAQQMDMIGRMVGGIAHDFNNLLAVVIGHAELLADRMPAGSREREDLDQVLTASKSAAAMTRQLLSLSRKLPARLELVHVPPALDEIAPMLRSVLREDIRLELRVDPALPPVQVDRGGMDRLLMNLVLNARDALPRGGTITVAAGLGTLPADVRPAPPREAGAMRWVVLSVTDDGVGIPHALQERIFEPFFSTKEPGAGTGLGLVTVYDLTRESGGHLQCESTPGEGTTFRVFFPAASGDRVAGTNADPERPAPREGTILVVEDVPAVRRIVQRCLEHAGYRVRVADGADTALQYLREDRAAIDLLVTDVIMPGVRGPELAEQVRTTLPGLPVLFMSGYAHTETGLSLGSGGPTGFLMKPFTTTELLTEVARLLVAARPRDRGGMVGDITFRMTPSSGP